MKTPLWRKGGQCHGHGADGKEVVGVLTSTVDMKNDGIYKNTVK